MANIKFTLRNTNTEKEQTVYITARFGQNEKLMYATPLKVSFKFWDESKQRVKNSKYCYYKDDTNSAITSIESKVKMFIAEAAQKGIILTKDSLRIFLDVSFGKKRPLANTFHAFFEEYIRLCDTKISSVKAGQKISTDTKSKYVRTYYYLKEFEKARNIRLEFDRIDQDLMADFVAYLQSLNLAANTISDKVMRLKAVMNAANDRELTNNKKYKAFKYAMESNFSIALNESELDKLYGFDFSYNSKLEKARDMFLIGCWTGLRFSDFTRIRKENIRDGMLTIIQQKTNEPVTIPLHPVFLRIWEKYNGLLPTKISAASFDRYLKKLCQKAGLVDHVLKSITKGGKRCTSVYEKWQLISAHTARRSFATNLYKSGFPSISIMAITGHKTESSFLRYIKVSKEEHAKLLMLHWQKNGNLLKVL